jgi:hypothetical protein
LTNKGATPVEGWAVEFDLPHEITEIWNGIIESRDGDRYRIQNETWNTVIQPGKSASFGFSATPGNVTIPTVTVYRPGEGPTVLLVYRSLVNAYRHSRVGDAWKYDGDKQTEHHYLVFEFDPTRRIFTQNAVRIVYGDKVQTKEAILPFEELDKEYRVGEDKPYMRYVVGSMFDVESANVGHGEILYGNVFLQKPSDIGWSDKVAVARAMKGKINAENPDEWKNYVVSTRINFAYTRWANSTGQSFSDVVKTIQGDLEKTGFTPLR